MTTLQLLSLVVAIAAVFAFVSRRLLRLPVTIGTMLLTVALSLALRFAGWFAPGLHTWAADLVQRIDFQQLILHGMLSLLLFAGAFLLDLERLMEQRLVIATLALAGTVLTAALIAVSLHAGLPLLGIATSWRAALLFGALISPTDPIAVLEMLRRVGVSRTLQAQLAGESLFNDGIGAVLFLSILGTATGDAVFPLHIASMLMLQIGGALLLGTLAAFVTSWLMRRVDAYEVDILLTLSLALGGYAVAEALHVSAPLEAVISAIALRYFNARHDSRFIAHESIDRFWEVLDEIQNAVLFVLLGLEALAVSFTRASTAAGLLAIALVLAARFVVVAGLLGTLRLCRARVRSSVAVLSWGGLHGGLSLALALSLPRSESPQWLLLATYMVVLFSVAVQGGSMPYLLSRFRSLPPSKASVAL